MRRILGALSLCTALLSAQSATAGSNDYWVCIDAQGHHLATDRPCPPDQTTEYAPESKKPIQTAPTPQPVQTQSTPNTGKANPPQINSAHMFDPMIHMAFKGFALFAVLMIGVAVIKAALLGKRKGKKSRVRAWKNWNVDMSTKTSDYKPAPPPKYIDQPEPDRLYEASRPSPKTQKTDFDLELLHELEWKRFEDLCEGFWSIKGYPSRTTGAGADGGVDIVITDRADNSKIFAIAQCKAYAKPVGVELVRSLWGCKDHFKAQLAIFYGLSGFTEDSKKFAEGKHLKLISGSELLRNLMAWPDTDRAVLFQRITSGDYQTPTCSRCDIKMVRRPGAKGKPDFWGCTNFPRCKQTMWISS